MSKFKKGDIVVRISEFEYPERDNHFLKRWGVYRVVDSNPSSTEIEGSAFLYRTCEFKLAKNQIIKDIIADL